MSQAHQSHHEAAPAAREDRSRSGVQLLARPALLYVDDDLHVRKSFARIAHRMGFEVTLASSGREALEAAADRKYAVIVSDLCMPDTDGLQLVTRLYDVQPNASYVLVTGLGQVELPADDVLDKAICCTVYKPWDIETLKRALTRAAELHAARCETQAAQPETVRPRPRVLLVEDNAGDAELATELLGEHSDAAVTRAVRLSDAVEYLRWDEYDLILADLSLPDARGLDAVTGLQSVAAQTPIVVLSGLDDHSLAGQAVQLGAQDFLVKNRLDGELLSRSLLYARERKRAEQGLARLARVDPLTDLANRSCFLEQLSQLLARTRRARARCYVMYIDLDGFKLINDSYGHDVGDSVLRQFAQRLRDVVRDCDVIARIGGDEFVVAGGDLSTLEAALEIAQRILRALARPMTGQAGSSLVVKASIGIAVFPDAAESRDALLSAADSAMYSAKRAGGNAARLCEVNED